MLRTRVRHPADLLERTIGLLYLRLYFLKDIEHDEAANYGGHGRSDALLHEANGDEEANPLIAKIAKAVNTPRRIRSNLSQCGLGGASVKVFPS